jgi:hypothetical protein
MGKVMTGSVPNESTLKSYRDTFSPNASPQKMMATIKAQMNLLAGRVGTNADMYQKTIGVKPPSAILDDEAVNALKDMGLNAADYDPSYKGDTVDSYGSYSIPAPTAPNPAHITSSDQV